MCSFQGNVCSGANSSIMVNKKMLTWHKDNGYEACVKNWDNPAAIKWLAEVCAAKPLFPEATKRALVALRKKMADSSFSERVLDGM